MINDKNNVNNNIESEHNNYYYEEVSPACVVNLPLPDQATQCLV